MKRIYLLAATTLLIAGCATPPPEVVEVEQKEVEPKVDRVNRNLTLSWDNMGRGGAALRQPAYVHVLGDGNLHTSGSDGAVTVGQLPPINPQHLLTTMDNINNRNTNQGFSIYELSRWERYCNQGKRMDEPDWRFVTEHGGREGVPDIYHGRCSPPAHDYQGYLQAWTAFCTGDETMNPVQRDIVRNSVRPQSVVNPCSALTK